MSLVQQSRTGHSNVFLPEVRWEIYSIYDETNSEPYDYPLDTLRPHDCWIDDFFIIIITIINAAEFIWTKQLKE